MLLVIGALNKSNVQLASKSVATIKEYPVLKTIILQLMLDVLLLPYKWSGSDEDPLAGFDKQTLKRLRLNIPIIFTDADYHEQVIVFIFLSCFFYYTNLFTMILG